MFKNITSIFFVDSSLYIVASIHLCNIRGLVTRIIWCNQILCSIILNMASLDMILYMTLICICFRYLLCCLGHLSYPILNTVMYFGHHFPMTSHIRGHLLSCKMTLLRPSADIHYVDTQKDKLKWSRQNTIDVHDHWCMISRPSWYILF